MDYLGTCVCNNVFISGSTIFKDFPSFSKALLKHFVTDLKYDVLLIFTSP